MTYNVIKLYNFLHLGMKIKNVFRYKKKKFRVNHFEPEKKRGDSVKISVVVATFNVEKYIAQCINSILDQSYKDFELLLVDDGSTDRSSTICDEYAEKDDRVKVIHKENGGVSSARNTGISHSKGDYIYFVDGDDFIHKNTLESFINVTNGNPEPDFIIGRMSMFIDGTDNFEPDVFNVSNKVVQEKSGQEAFVAILNDQGLIRMGVRGLYRRQFLLENNLFFVDHLYSEDSEWTIRLFLNANKIFSNDAPYYYYRASRPGSYMNTLNVKKANDLITIYDNWIKYLMNNEVLTSFYDALLKETGKRYTSMFYTFSAKLSSSELEEFYENIKKTKYIFKYSRGIKYQFVRYLVDYFGVKTSSHILRMASMWK